MTRFVFILTFFISFCAIGQNKAKPDSTKKSTAAVPCHSIKEIKKFPEFPGGQAKMKEFIYQNLQKPKDAVAGKVYIKFTVDSTGQVIDPIVIKGINTNSNKAVLEVINKFPRFNPALDKSDKPIICDQYVP